MPAFEHACLNMQGLQGLSMQVLSMSGEFSLPGWIGLHVLIACIGTWVARRYALHRRLLDHPGDRRSHQVATPRGGGVAIVIAVAIALGWLIIRSPASLPFYGAAAIGLLLVAGVGWIDDHRPLSAGSRLFVHGVAGAILAYGVLAQGGSASLAVVAFCVALVLVNVWNFMDGIDGLAASQAALVALGYAAWSMPGALAWLALALAAACAGFLPFNLPRARIFLGDVGSGALGFTVAILLVGLAGRRGNALPVLLLPLSAFLIDATLTLTMRMLRGERWWQAHVQHAYQQWAQRTGRHGVVTTAYAGWTLAAVAIMLLTGTASLAMISAIVVAWYAVGSIAWLRLRQDYRRIARRGRE